MEIMCGLLDQVEGRMDIEVKFRRQNKGVEKDEKRKKH